MTAEIAIMNKLAVALATDSAVTIAAGGQEQKIFDSADKLFDLSYRNPLGIMIYNGMQFMQAPLPMIIAEYRSQCLEFDTVQSAAEDFLSYLREWGSTGSEQVSRGAIEALIFPILSGLQERISQKQRELFEASDGSDLMARFHAIPGEIIHLVEGWFNRIEDGEFVGGSPEIGAEQREIIRSIIATVWPGDPSLLDQLVNLGCLAIRKDVTSPGHTGIVIAGFGTKDKFPTLVS